MRKIKTIDDITKDGKVEFGKGYEFVGTAEEADAILMRSTDLHGYELPEGIREEVGTKFPMRQPGFQLFPQAVAQKDSSDIR